jgi:hypothetical protein
MRFPCSEGNFVELPSELVTSLKAVLSEAVPPLLDWFPMVMAAVAVRFRFGYYRNFYRATETLIKSINKM